MSSNVNNDYNNQVEKNFSINASNKIITQQNVVKYLGVYIDKQLTWKNPIKHVIEKLSIVSDIISKLKYYDPITILTLAYTFTLRICIVKCSMGEILHVNKLINFKFNKIVL